MIAIIYGEDTSRAQYKLNRLKEAEKPDVYIRLDALKDDPSEFFRETQSMSLFPEKKMVVLDNADFLTSKNTTPYELDAVFGCDLDDGLIVYMTSKPRLDGRKKKVKELQAKAKVIECQVLDEKSAPSVIREMLKEKKLEMEPEAFKWYAAHAGTATAKIDTELDKMSVYSDHLKLEDVKALTSIEPLDNVFKMTDALFSRKGMLLLNYYRNFRQSGMEPIAICAMLASQVRFVYQVRVLMDQGVDKKAMEQMLGASSGRIYNTQKNASRFSASQLLSTLNELAVLDQNMKRGIVDKDQGFENFIFDMVLEENELPGLQAARK